MSLLGVKGLTDDNDDDDDDDVNQPTVKSFKSWYLDHKPFIRQTYHEHPWKILQLISFQLLLGTQSREQKLKITVSLNIQFHKVWKKLIKDKYSLQLQHYHLWVCVTIMSGSPKLKSHGPGKERVMLVRYCNLMSKMIKHF